MVRFWRRDSLYKLSEILAILSGTWMVAAGITASTIWSLIGITVNSMNTGNVSSAVTQSIGNSVIPAIHSYSVLFGCGLIFGVLSIIAWIYGSVRQY